MSAVYHPDVQKDVSKILHHYDRINPRLGDEFWAEVNSFIAKAVENPGRFHFEAPGRRRVNLHRFPIHFLFREIPFVMCAILNHVKHHKPRLRVKIIHFRLTWLVSFDGVVKQTSDSLAISRFVSKRKV